MNDMRKSCHKCGQPIYWHAILHGWFHVDAPDATGCSRETYPQAERLKWNQIPPNHDPASEHYHYTGCGHDPDYGEMRLVEGPEFCPSRRHGVARPPRDPLLIDTAGASEFILGNKGGAAPQGRISECGHGWPGEWCASAHPYIADPMPVNRAHGSRVKVSWLRT